MVKLFTRLYDKKIEATGLGIFRIFYFLIFFCELLQMFYFRHLIFDEVPYIRPFEVNLGLPLGVWMVCVIFLMLGFLTRYMTIVNYIFNLVFLSTISSYEYHIIYIYTTLNFLCIFLPISRSVSVDRWWQKVKYSNTRFQYNPPNKTTVLSYLLPLYMVCGLTYFDSVIFKVGSSFWMDGLGVWFPTAFPHTTIVPTDGIGSLVANNKTITIFLGYLTLIFETFFIFLFWFRRFRVPLLIVGMGLHLGILIAFPIPWFALTMAVIYLLMVPAAWWRNIGRFLQRGALRPRVVVYYDEECPLCARLKITVEHFDLFSNVSFKGVQSSRDDEAIKDIELDPLLDNIHSADRQGKVHIGIDTYIQILDAMRYTLPLSLILRIPGIYHLARAVYRYVATHREVERCTEDNCGYTPPQLPPKIDTIKLLSNLKIYDIKMRGIMYFFILVTLAQCFISYESGVVHGIRSKLGLKGTSVDKFMVSLAWALEGVGKPYLGLTHHALFMDYHFKDYNHVVALSYIEEDGTETWLPIMDKNGTPQWYIYGTNWAKWTFRVNGAGKMREKMLGNGIRDFTAFWAHKHGKGTKDGRYRIHLKLVEIPQNGFEPDLLKKQQKIPWVELGTATWKDDQFEMTIREEHIPLFTKSKK
ncbi:MAG: DCC1-like thiol-disulfide oxidoreductase family protein [Saprospiraceae bacterium]|nr:DCC1-like thiol-disulfide oxidoreductase family protein [Saprospiraceae bacterium]